MVRRVRRIQSGETASEKLRRLARNVFMRLAGASFAAFGLFAALALMTYSVSDPSWSTATAREASNLMGPRGASLADLFLQLLGPASIALIGPMAFWGAWVAWRGLPSETPLVGWLRIIAGPIAVFALAGFCSALPT
ncbi:MAG: DNA translocase FtsK 4TM domain-containing protein, partial [Pseudomonadota bacterium]